MQQKARAKGYKIKIMMARGTQPVMQIIADKWGTDVETKMNEQSVK